LRGLRISCIYSDLIGIVGLTKIHDAYSRHPYAPSALYPLLRDVNQTLLAWAMRKFKRFVDHKIRASQFLQKLARDHAHLFVHWRLGMSGTFA
jgi:hypothetical protein